jgi:signal transduction histidine kinase
MEIWIPQKTWGHLRAGAIELRKRFSIDIFTLTELRIIALYLIMGMIILAGAGSFVYSHIVATIGTSTNMVLDAVSAGTPANQILAQHIVASVVTGETHTINFWLGFWILLAIIISAYILAGVMLEPIRRAAETQKQLIGNVSHELRTPLSIMKTNTEVIFAGTEAPMREELIAGLTSSLEEVNRITKIVNFFLNFSLGKEWEKKIELSEVDLSAIVRKTVQLIGVVAKEKEVVLSVHDDGPAFILGNVVTLEEMLINLIKNSIAYTPTGGKVSVDVRHDGSKEVTLSVQDTGIGIPEKDLPRIFEPFYRGENAFSQRTKRRGSGIGLSIVKEIADLHRARIFLESELGKGTLVIIKIPLTRQDLSLF